MPYIHTHNYLWVEWQMYCLLERSSLSNWTLMSWW
jgi:hypothetical protein